MLPRSFEATVSRDEFLRLLRSAVGDERFEIDGDWVAGASGWRIRLTPLTAHSFGSVAMARLRVDTEFPGWQDAAVDGFMRRFALFFQRGGG
jgi:hypothetical protein